MSCSELKARARAQLGGGIFQNLWMMGLAVCLLVGLMALTVFTACDASVGAPMSPKRSDAESESVKALRDKFKMTYNVEMTYNEDLSEKAYYVAYWVAGTSPSCSVNKEKTELSRKDNIGNDAKALLQMENPRYASAFDCMGIGKGIGGGLLLRLGVGRGVGHRLVGILLRLFRLHLFRQPKQDIVHPQKLDAFLKGQLLPFQ